MAYGTKDRHRGRWIGFGCGSRSAGVGAEPRGNPWMICRESPPKYGLAGDSSDVSPFLADLRALGGLTEEDLLEELGTRIIRLSAHSAALDFRLLVLIAHFDRRRGWEVSGHKDCAAWLEAHTGMSRVTARERVRMARKLTDLPQISETMARGELSYSKVRALVRVATAENEGELLPMARECTARELEREVARFRELDGWKELGAEARRHQKRYLRIRPAPDGMVRVEGRLPADLGALLMKVVDAASDALFQSGTDWSPEEGDWGLTTETVTPDQRRADALRLVLDRAMAAGFRGIAADSAETPDSAESPRKACGCVQPSPSAERYTVMVHLRQDPDRAELDTDLPISLRTARRLSCDASVVRIVHGPKNEVLDVGRKTRVVPPAIRRALWARDGGCSFPGCGARYVSAHHIVHWADGGRTALDNLVLLCPAHHRGVHEGGFTVQMTSAGPRFRNRAGVRIPDRAPPPRLPAEIDDPVAHLVRTHRFRGIAPDRFTGNCSARPPKESWIRFREVLDPAGSGLLADP
jgi:5-methylcytosine-specific restriction endonuclease McrA